MDKYYDLLVELRDEAKEQTAILRNLLEQFEDARAEFIKRNCSDNVKEQMKEHMASIGKSFENTPMAPIFEMMTKNLVPGR